MIGQTLYVSNMVCGRCVSVVAEVLRKVNIPFVSIQLGEVELLGPMNQMNREKLSLKLGLHGFVLLDHENTLMIERVKESILEIINDNSAVGKTSYAQLIAEKFHLDRQQISALFESVKCISLKKYGDLQKVEHVKECLINESLTIQQIAYKLGYRNIHHLSNQFREITGMTPARFRSLKMFDGSL